MSAPTIEALMLDGLGNPRKRYVRVVYEGSSCVCRPDEAEDIVKGEVGNGSLFGDGAPVVQQLDVYLSEAEFEALPEFEGF